MASMTANITTTAGGASSIFGFLNRRRPSVNLAKGEAYLGSTIYTIENTLDKRKDSDSLKDFDELREEHDILSSKGDGIREVVEAPLTLGNVQDKVIMVVRARNFAKEAKELNSKTQRSSRKAASRRVKDKMVSFKCIREAEDTTPAQQSTMPVRGPDAGETTSACGADRELGPYSSAQVRTPPTVSESWPFQASGQSECDIPLEILEDPTTIQNSNSPSEQSHVSEHVQVEAASDDADPFVDQHVSGSSPDIAS